MEPGEHHFEMGVHPHPLGILFGLGSMLLFWGLLLGVPAWFILRRIGRDRWHAMTAGRYPAARQVSQAAEPSAMELLRRRYVQGEIDHATFEEMMHHLTASQAHERNIPWSAAREPRPAQDPREGSGPEVPASPEDVV